MLENGAPHDKFGVLYHPLHMEFRGFNSRIDVLGLSHFVPVINPIFSKTVWVPFRDGPFDIWAGGAYILKKIVCFLPGAKKIKCHQ